MDNIIISEKIIIETIKKILSCPILVKEKVDNLLYKYSASTEDRESVLKKVFEDLVKEKVKKSSAIGGVVAIPAIIPGVGTIGTLAVALGFEIFAVTKLEVELCLEMAYLYGKDIEDEKERVKDIIIILEMTGKDIKDNVYKEVKSKFYRKVFKTAFIRLFPGLSKKLSGKYFYKVGLKALPLIGVPIGARYNYVSMKKTGQKIVDYYTKTEIV